MQRISPLVVLDCDATTIEQEVIELIAQRAGRLQEVARITEQAMRGEIDFAQSLKQRVATLRGLHLNVLKEVTAEITFSAGFDALVAATHAAAGKVCVVSGGFIEVLDQILPARMVDRWHANRLEIIDNKLTGRILGEIVDSRAKAVYLQKWANEFNISTKHTIAVGDGANDLEMMQVAAISVGFKPKPIVRERADYSFDDSLSSVANLFARLSG